MQKKLAQRQSSKPVRLTCLDVFRGIAITGMLIVNNPGSWQHVYSPFLHAKWHGCTPADLVFPFFLFILGTAMAFSFTSRAEQSRVHSSHIYLHIIRRAAILFALGLLLNAFSPAIEYVQNNTLINIGAIRIMGVLQRISLVYLLAGIAVVNFSQPKLLMTACGILLGYWLVILLIPVPGYGAGGLLPENNITFYIDSLILKPEHMYRGGSFDPEGLLSTLPAVATVLSGYFTGHWLTVRPVNTTTSLKISIAGLILLSAGKLWGLSFPVNKALWTSSFVIFTAGLALLFLALCYELIEVRGLRYLGRPFEVLGLNSIFIYVASGIFTRILQTISISTDGSNTYIWIYENLFAAWAGHMNGSLAFSLTYIVFWWLVLYAMHRKRWFIKL